MDKYLHTLTVQDSFSIYNTLFENTHEGIIITDQNGIIQAVNPAFCVITGYTPEEMVGKTPSVLQSGRHDEEFYKSLWAKVKKIGRWNGNIWDRKKNGEVFLIELTITAVKSSKRNVKIYAVIFTDHTNSSDRLVKKPNYDPLTNLPNR
ncbi:MAG: PAS domain S-box protein, partial [Ignavibacteria bacterium]|nr:PAS domain S-box protein [Ignavibacteria bacterium]